MHPSELKNQAVVAAAIAERGGFFATAEALMLLAKACAAEAQDLLEQCLATVTEDHPRSTQDRARVFEVTH